MLMVAADGEPPLVFVETPPIYLPIPHFQLPASSFFFFLVQPQHAHGLAASHRAPSDVNIFVRAAYTVAIKAFVLHNTASPYL